MLDKLFTSTTRIEILKLLMFNQDKEYHLRGIAKIIKAVPIHASKELDNLVSLGLVKKSKVANLNLYKVNKESIILQELRDIFIKTDYIGELIRQKLSSKAKYCLIYGSFAKGTESEKSDIDLFVVSEISEDELVKIIGEIEKLTNREINYVLWNQKTFDDRAKGHHLLRTIKKGKIIMIIGNENEFRKQIK